MDNKTKMQIEKNLHHLENGKTIDLSQEILSITDYEWLSVIIKKSSFLESIILPEIPYDLVELIFSILNKAIINNSTLTSIIYKLPFKNHQIPDDLLCCIQQIESRLKRNAKQIFAIHGGGNIGLGLMADVVSQSPFDYHIIATSDNLVNRTLVNSVSKLWLYHGEVYKGQETQVNNVRMISRNTQDVTQLYKDACLAAICVTPSVLPEVAGDVALALIERFNIDGSGLKLLVLMNIPHCAQFVKEAVRAKMISILKDQKKVNEILSASEFVPTVIDRIVTPIDVGTIKKQLQTQLSSLNFDDLMTTPEKLAEIISANNLQFNLFNAEKNFTIYAPENVPELRRLPCVRRTKNLAQLEAVKNKYINGPHAILAWTGALFGCATISESINHPVIYRYIKAMMLNEIGPILMAEYPELSKNDLDVMSADFFARCSSSVDDPVNRVGRDPLRKLDSGGRIRGTIELATKHHLKIPTTALEQGVAAGILYAVKGLDPSNSGCKKILEIYERSNHSFVDILCYNGSAPSGTFTGLNPNQDGKLIQRILFQIKVINGWYDRMAAHEAHETSNALVVANRYPFETQVQIPKIYFTAVDHLFFRCVSKGRMETRASRNLGYTPTATDSFTLAKNVFIKRYQVNHDLWKDRSSKADQNTSANIRGTQQLLLKNK